MGKFKTLAKKTFPQFLVVLVFLEAWERYSFFTMRSIGLLYMTSIMKMDDKRALTTHHLISSIGNLLTMPMGFVADRLFGFRAMALVGGLLIGIAHFLLAASYFDDPIYFWAVGTMALGTGIFKGNLSNLLGSCYDRFQNLDRISGFTLFFASANLGTFFSYLTAGYFSAWVGFHFTYSIAGFGMLIGLAVFLYFKNIYVPLDFSGNKDLLKKKIAGINIIYYLFVMSLVLTLPVSILLYYAEIVERINMALWIAIVIIVLLSYVTLTIKKQRDRMAYIILSFYFSYLLILQTFLAHIANSIVLYVDRNVYKYIGTLYLTPQFALTLDPIVTVTGGIILSFYKHKEKYEFPKILYTLIVTVLGLFIFYIGLVNADPETALTSYMYPVVGLIFMSTGELAMTPLMQAVTTVYAPKPKRGLTMGIYTSIQGLGSLILVAFSYLFDVPVNEHGEIDPHVSREVYLNGYFTFFWMSACCLIYFFFTYIIVYILKKKIAKIDAEEAKKSAPQHIESVAA